MHRPQNGTFDSGTYSTYCTYTDAVCQVTDTIFRVPQFVLAAWE